MDDFSISNPEYLWLGLAALLALAELFVPGVFLIWVAAAAAVTGILSLFIDLTVAGQLTLFGLATILAVLGGRRWYLTHEVESENPLLNNRAAQLVGRTVKRPGYANRIGREGSGGGKRGPPSGETGRQHSTGRPACFLTQPLSGPLNSFSSGPPVFQLFR